MADTVNSAHMTKSIKPLSGEKPNCPASRLSSAPTKNRISASAGACGEFVVLCGMATRARKML